MSNIDTKLFDEYVEKKLITRREHPSKNMLIWNYTPVTQFSKAWDEVTLQARGLITDYYGQIISRPFSKFFNYGEYQGEIPAEQYPSISEKMDGSLGILYKHGDTIGIATRGSFESDQAIHATGILNQYLLDRGADWIKPGWTYLFEIIYPTNRIVVDYGDRDELVLLAILDTETGEDVPMYAVDHGWAGPVVQFVDSHRDLDSLAAENKPNHEGYVVRFSNGLRLKVKFEEYVRLHRLLTNISSKVIWELMKDGKSLDEIIANVPDEFYDWVTKVRQDLTKKYGDLYAKVMSAAVNIPVAERKEQAAWIFENHKDISGMLFNYLTGKDFSEQIWKAIKPTYELPFRKDIDV